MSSSGGLMFTGFTPPTASRPCRESQRKRAKGDPAFQITLPPEYAQRKCEEIEEDEWAQ